MKDRTSWTNWAGNQSCAPTLIRRPASEAELIAIVKDAAASGTHVKCVGAGHSFTPIACTDGELVDLSGYDRVLRHDVEARTVTVQAGITLSTLCEELDQRGLALENMGDIAYQSIAGATATATHGTGWHFGNISSRIVGLRLIAGDGSIMEATADENPDVLAAARVGVGALGIVSTVTIEAVTAFRLHAIEEPMRLDDLLVGLRRLHVQRRPRRVLLGAPHGLGADQAQSAHGRAGRRRAARRRRSSTTSCSPTWASGRCAASAGASRAGSPAWPRSFRRPDVSSTPTAAIGCSPAPAG